MVENPGNGAKISNHDQKPKDNSNIINNCNRTIGLEYFTEKHSRENQIFFLETSGKNYLTGREICSVESAARSSNLTVQVLMFSKSVNLTVANGSCQVYHGYNNVNFYWVNLSKEVEETPVEGIQQRLGEAERLQWKHRVVHYSDILRQVIVYKYGGFYADLDIVITKDLSSLTNVIALQNAGPQE